MEEIKEKAELKVMNETSFLLSEKKVVNPTQSIKPNWINYCIKVTDEFTDPEPVLVQGNKTLCSRGNVATITGKPKAFKTFLNSGICAGFLEDETLTISSPINNGKALFIDTEQSRSHAQKVQKRIYTLCGYDTETVNNRFTFLSLRELSPKDRLKNCIEAIETLSPDFVIIDGIRDLVIDFNDLKESAIVVGELMRLSSAYNCAIVVVLHQNKADSNARGHLGSELCNKSETVLQVVNNNGTATVSPVYCRNQEPGPFSFYINADGLPELCDAPKVAKKTKALVEMIKGAMLGQSWLSYTDLVKKISQRTGKTERTGKRKISDAITAGILKYNEAKYLILATTDNIDNSVIPYWQ